MSNASKEAILAAIRTNKPLPVAKPGLRDFGRSGVKGELLDTFKKNLKTASANFYDLKDMTEAQYLLKEIHPDAKVICSAVKGFEGNRLISPETDPHMLEDVEVGILRARFGIAENGAVYLTQEDMIVNALGYLAQHLIILLDPSAIVTHMHDAYKKVAFDEHNYAVFMMGPSATADISAVHINGAQGARSLNVFFIAAQNQ